MNVLRSQAEGGTRIALLRGPNLVEIPAVATGVGRVKTHSGRRTSPQTCCFSTPKLFRPRHRANCRQPAAVLKPASTVSRHDIFDNHISPEPLETFRGSQRRMEEQDAPGGRPSASAAGGASEEGIQVSLTYEPLDVSQIIASVKSPKAGAVVLFAGIRKAQSRLHCPTGDDKRRLTRTLGTTRDTFQDKPVKQLQYSAYVPLAVATLLDIARTVREKHSLTAITMTHRLGVVPIAEESILIAVSSPHRRAAWRAGEEALEMCKEKAEIWKLEEFHGGEAVWKANRDETQGSSKEAGQC